MKTLLLMLGLAGVLIAPLVSFATELGLAFPAWCSGELAVAAGIVPWVLFALCLDYRPRRPLLVSTDRVTAREPRVVQPASTEVPVFFEEFTATRTLTLV